VLDARRMEVYVRPFRWERGSLVPEGPAQAVDLNEGRPAGSGLSAPALVVIGDAVEKVEQVHVRPDAVYVHCEPDAAGAGALLAGTEPVDLAYFEPRYLKEFLAGAPKDPLGLRSAALDPPPHA
jgi:tRNA threonylcarbamoyladenosine biosynthesis protein TsaB